MKKHKQYSERNQEFKNSKMSNYIHYALTYIPIIGTLFGGYYLSNLLMKEGRPIKKIIYLIFIFSAICSIYSFSLTKFQNVNAEFVNRHFEWLDEKITFVYLSVGSLSLLGFLSLIGLFFIQNNYPKELSLGIVISILALFSSIFSIRSEYIHPSWKFYTSYSEFKETNSIQPITNLKYNEKIRK